MINKETGEEVRLNAKQNECFPLAKFSHAQMKYVDELPKFGPVNTKYDILLDSETQLWACATYYKFTFQPLAEDKMKEVHVEYGRGNTGTLNYRDMYILPCIHEQVRRDSYYRDDLEFQWSANDSQEID